MAVEDVLAPIAVELDQEFGLAPVVHIDGVLPALVVGAGVTLATAEDLERREVNVDRMLHIEGADLPQFDRAELGCGVDAIGVERLAVDSPQRYAVHLRPTPDKPELAFHGGVRSRKWPEVDQLRWNLAVLLALARHDETHHLRGVARADLIK